MYFDRKKKDIEILALSLKNIIEISLYSYNASLSFQNWENIHLFGINKPFKGAFLHAFFWMQLHVHYETMFWIDI